MNVTSNIENHAIEPWKLWGGLFGGPVVWFVQFQTNYSLVSWCCAHSNKLVLLIVSVVFILLAIGSCVLAITNSRELASANVKSFETGSFAMCRFMSQVGTWTSILFILLIIGQAIPPFILDPCSE